MDWEISVEMTHKIERFESLEERFGVRIEALYAVFQQQEFLSRLLVNFDVIAVEGRIKEDLKVQVSAYNSNGQLVGTDYAGIYHKDLIGMTSCSESIDLETPPEHIRVYVQKR